MRTRKSTLCARVLFIGLLGVMLLGALLGQAPTCALAVEGASVRTVDAITLAEDQSEFSFSLMLEHPDPFVGAEVAIQCGEGVEITAVTYSPSASQAGPKDARGLTWFGLFSGDNDFAGTVKATIYATYAGDENSSLVIDHASFYRKQGSAFETQNLALRKEIVLNRRGADNTPLPLDPPDGKDNAPGDGSPSGSVPGSGNPPSGALVSYNPPTNGAGGSGRTGSGDSDADGTTGAESSGIATTPGTEQGSLSDTAATLSAEQTPLSTVDSANNISDESTRKMDRTTLELAVIFLTIAAVLGFLLLVKNRRKQN
jgi:hypothetical protein